MAGWAVARTDPAVGGGGSLTGGCAGGMEIAALAAASLPVAAGVFVVSKVFNAQMDRLSTAVYRISGSWTDPQVSFDHIFDTSQASAAAASESVMKFGEIGGKDDDSGPDDIQPPAPSGSP